MGGASRVITGDTKDEVLEKAKEFFIGCEEMGFYPRRDFIYGSADTPVNYQSPRTGELETAYVILVDITKTSEEKELPFPEYSKNLSEAEKKMKWMCFVSAHT